MHWFETELLTREKNLVGLMAVNRDVLAQAETHDGADRVVLDMDSSESPVHGQQEGSACNGHFQSVCYHPLFLFNDAGDGLAAKLRPGNVASVRRIGTSCFFPKSSASREEARTSRFAPMRRLRNPTCKARCSPESPYRVQHIAARIAKASERARVPMRVLRLCHAAERTPCSQLRFFRWQAAAAEVVFEQAQMRIDLPREVGL